MVIYLCRFVKEKETRIMKSHQNIFVFGIFVAWDIYILMIPVTVTM